MPTLRRLANVFKIGLDVLLTPADDPREQVVEVDQPLRRMLAQVQAALAGNRSLQTQLAGRVSELETRLAQFEAEARRALATSGEEVARAVLGRRQVLVAEVANMRTHTQALRHEGQRLALLEQRVLAQMELLAARQSLSATRYTAAEAQAQLGEMLAGLTAEFDALQQATEHTDAQTETLSARAAAIEDLLRSGALAGDSPFSPTDDIEAQLTALKRQ